MDRQMTLGEALKLVVRGIFSSLRIALLLPCYMLYWNRDLFPKWVPPALILQAVWLVALTIAILEILEII